MKGVLTVDPAGADYGPATASVRGLLRDWAAIDWFEPTAATDDELARLFHVHHACAREVAPARFPADLDLRCERGGWPEMIAWSRRVREATGWDWKYGALKPLSHDHATARGWSARDAARDLVAGPPQPGDLWFRYADPSGAEHVLCQGLMPRVAELEARARDGAAEAALFYLSYAQHDALDAIQWQLAEAHDDLAGNPFVPLIRGYAAGAYPFSLGPGEVVLFRFDAAAAV